jgi:hypothetical protein
MQEISKWGAEPCGIVASGREANILLTNVHEIQRESVRVLRSQIETHFPTLDELGTPILRVTPAPAGWLT